MHVYIYTCIHICMKYLHSYINVLDLQALLDHMQNAEEKYDYKCMDIN
jgi:hypothetical protein